MSDWQAVFQREIQQAETARSQANEGKARVCARRAAGVVIGEYLARQGEDPPASAYTRLQALAGRPEATPAQRAACERLLLRITPEHELPIPADLIADARALAHSLLGTSGETPHG